MNMEKPKIKLLIEEAAEVIDLENIDFRKIINLYHEYLIFLSNDKYFNLLFNKREVLFFSKILNIIIIKSKEDFLDFFMKNKKNQLWRLHGKFPKKNKCLIRLLITAMATEDSILDGNEDREYLNFDMLSLIIITLREVDIFYVKNFIEFIKSIKNRTV
ncbi:hypothetical protein [Delftia sp. PS-11]|uniref:hypothetical protein n=1 Tax=Delftia sp. PS-11 TaxID=2767222 RepID=UPI00245A77C0|nr:hypothetical protein H9T68_15035 [Delftia sp. PS-11]